MQKPNIFYYLCTVKKTEAILQSIEQIEPGVVFGYSDLKLPADVLSTGDMMFLSRLSTTGKLKKIGKGKFYKPIISRFGEMPIMPTQLTKDLLYKGSERIGYITGVPAFAQLGLTTQISSKIIIGIKKYRRPLSRGGYEISFTVQQNEITDDTIPLLRILDALKYIKEIPAATPDMIITNLISVINKLSKREIELLIKLALNYTSSVRALLGAIFEMERQESVELKRSLNRFTKYKIGISQDVLPTKSNWDII